MPDVKDLKSLVSKEIDAHAEEIIGVAKTVWQHPEPGFREEKTSRFISQKLSAGGV